MIDPEKYFVPFPLYFVGIWLGISFLISRMGWHGFASRYAAKERPQGESFNCPTASFGNPFGSYRNVMRVVFAQEGVYIYPMFLFRVFHSAFLVPWGKIIGVKEKRIFWTKRNILEIRDGTSEIDIVLTGRARREFERVKGLLVASGS